MEEGGGGYGGEMRECMRSVEAGIQVRLAREGGGFVGRGSFRRFGQIQ